MKVAVALLLIIIAACVAGSVIPQGKSLAWYTQTYSERGGALIAALRLDDVFHSVWFLVLTGFLCCNLLLCNLLRLPRILRRWKTEGQEKQILESAANVSHSGVMKPEAAFCRLHMPKPKPGTERPDEILYSVKDRLGVWGAWVCHLGILLLIIGFTLGQLTKKEYTVYGATGQTRQIGDTDYLLTVDSFEVTTREDGFPEDYAAEITVRDLDGDEPRSAALSVNHPASLFGMKFYQNSYGRAARIRISEGGELQQDTVLCVGESIRLRNQPDIVILFDAFYPDYTESADGPGTASLRLNRPAYAYAFFYKGYLRDTGVCLEDDPIVIRKTADDESPIEVLFSDPQYYTVLQVKTDRFVWLTLVGGVIVLLGLVLSFYVRPVKVWALRQPDGSWTVFGSCKKGGDLFKERFCEAFEDSVHLKE